MSLAYFYNAFHHETDIVLDDATLHYMYHVLRMKAGEECWVTNGRGVKCRVKIQELNKRHAQLEILETIKDSREASPLHLAIAFTKNPARIEWLLEKATEIGVGQITPLITHRSEKVHWKKERYEKILVSAMLQSQQTYLPLVHEPTSLQHVVGVDAEARFIAWCDAHEEKKPLSSCLKKNKKTIILIGPEGDFTQEEVDLCRSNGYLPVSLGPTRLRTETAGLYAVVAFNASV